MSSGNASLILINCCCSVAVWLDFLQTHGLQHASLPCPSLSPRVCSNSCPLVSDAIQPSHPLPSHSLPAFSLSQHRVFYNESAFHIRWPKYWSFSFSISPSNEFSGLISFRIDWFDLDKLRDRKNKVCTIMKMWGLSSAYRGPSLLMTK